MGSHWCGVRSRGRFARVSENKVCGYPLQQMKAWGLLQKHREYLSWLFLRLLLNSPMYCRYTGLGIRVNQTFFISKILFKTCEVMKRIFYVLYGWMYHNTNKHNKRALSSRFWTRTEIHRFKCCKINFLSWHYPQVPVSARTCSLKSLKTNKRL